MKFVFVNKLPLHKSGVYAHYNHHQVKDNKWEHIDIRSFIVKNQIDWLDQVDLWHAKMSKFMLEQTTWWWLMPASRFYAWYPPILKPLFFAIALSEYSATIKEDEIYLVNFPKDAYDYFVELNPNAATNILKEGISKKEEVKGKRLIVSLKNILGVYARVLRRYCLDSKMFLNKNFKVTGYSKIKIIVVSLFLDIEKFAKEGDHFFGKIFFDRSKTGKDDLLWFYMAGVKRHQSEKIDKYMNSKSNRYITNLDLLTLTDINKIVINCLLVFLKIKFLRETKPLLKIDKYRSDLFVNNYFTKLIKNELPVSELAVYFSFKKMLIKTNTCSVIYPYEEKGFERAIILACRETKRNIRTIGYAHAVYNPGILYLRDRDSGLINSPKPDILATTGKASNDWLIKWARINASRLMVVGSNRNVEAFPLKNNFKTRQICLQLLVLIGQGHEMEMLANFAESLDGLFDHCKVLIRKYPYLYNEQQEEGLKRLDKSVKNLSIESGSLHDQLFWCDVALFCSTSAGIESMLRGRFSIYVELHDVIELDPISGKGDRNSIVDRCSSPSELKEILNYIRKMNDEEYNEKIKKQRDFASQIFAPIKTDKLCQMILEDSCEN